MAKRNVPRPGRALLVVGLLVAALYAAVFGTGAHPKLGLDLQGGTSVILTAQAPKGGKVTQGAIDQAVDIIRQRVNGLGVSEAQVTTQGSDNIVVSVPGKGRREVVDLVGETAQLRFRQVIAVTSGAPTPQPSATPSGSASPGTTPRPGASATPSGSTTPSASAQPRPSASASATARPRALSEGLLARPAAAVSTLAAGAPLAAGTPVAAGTPTPKASASATPPAATPSPTATAGAPAPDPALITQFTQLDCSKPSAREGGGQDDPTKQVVACSKDGTQKYLLAPAGVLGNQIKDAQADLNTQTAVGWEVLLDFKGKGVDQWCALTTKAAKASAPQNQVAIVLDGVVQSAPALNNGPICGGNAQITGSFGEQEAKNLANVLKYGALPLRFEKSSVNDVSPTLGSDQLHGGLIAGAIGLGLVVLYSLLFYRGLGLVTIASLVLSGGLLYAAVVLLGQAINYTLSLAGIAGFIVAVGITADSFVVFFERIRDEIREGRTASVRSAVERAWPRARRTILSADTVSILGAVILYLLTVGSVQGFAFTLGLSTLCDLFIVFMFTKPLVTLIVRSKLFHPSSPFSGLGATTAARTSGQTSRRTSATASEEGV